MSDISSTQWSSSEEEEEEKEEEKKSVQKQKEKEVVVEEEEEEEEEEKEEVITEKSSEKQKEKQKKKDISDESSEEDITYDVSDVLHTNERDNINYNLRNVCNKLNRLDKSINKLCVLLEKKMGMEEVTDFVYKEKKEGEETFYDNKFIDKLLDELK